MFNKSREVVEGQCICYDVLTKINVMLFVFFSTIVVLCVELFTTDQTVNKDYYLCLLAKQFMNFPLQ